jgi:prepilin-type processing-associated H-X9-DG protein
VVFIVYGVVALALMLRIVVAMALLVVKVRRSTEVTSSAGYSIRRLEDGGVPMTAWVLRHVILVPSAWENWSQERQSIVLRHEQAHIRRGDWFWQVGGMVAAAVAWPVPFAWILLRQSRDLAEQAVDYIVVASGISPSTYANDLLCIAKDSQSVRMAAALPMATQPVARRIKMILANRPQKGIVTTSALIGTAIGFAVLTAGLSGWKLTQGEAQAATPEAVLKSFVDALDRKDPESALKEVMNAKVTPDLKKMFPLFKDFPGITLNSVTSSKEGNQAKVTCDWQFTPEPDRKFHDVLPLTRIDGKWKFVVPDHLPSGESISSLVYLFGSPKGIADSKAAAEKGTVKMDCLSNIKLIGLAALQFASDKDDIFEFGKTPYQTAIAKYLRSNKILTCPLDPPNTISYSFNSALMGKSLTKVAAPALTIMFYEGSNGKLNFRHDGKAMICFADGHAKGITANDLKFYTWDPSKRPSREFDAPPAAARAAQAIHP